MSTTKTQDALKGVAFLSGLAATELGLLAQTVRLRQLMTDQLLYRAGEPGDAMAIVQYGRLSVRVPPADAEVAAIYPGEVVGEMACVDPAPRSANVIASRPTTVMLLDRAMLLQFQKKVPELAVAIVGGIIEMLTRRIRDTNARIERALEAQGARQHPLPGPAGAPPAVGRDADSQRIDLAGLPLFQGFQPKHIRAFVTAAPPRSFSAGTVLCRERDPGTSCFVVARGSVEVLRHMRGQDQVLARLGEGSVVGQMALVDRAPRSATLRCAEETVALQLQRENFEQLLAARSPVAVRFQEHIARAGIQQLRMANGRLSTVLAADAPPLTAPPPRPRRPSSGEPWPVVGRPERATPAGGTGGVGGGGAAPRRPSTPGTLAASPPRRPSRPEVRLGGPGLEAPVMEDASDLSATLEYMQAALSEWGVSLSEVSVSRPDGVISGAELRSRKDRP